MQVKNPEHTDYYSGQIGLRLYGSPAITFDGEEYFCAHRQPQSGEPKNMPEMCKTMFKRVSEHPKDE
ncbi:MAG: hypothetical protein AUK31_06840 [Fibrobacteres bacterium CG2_30_45_31]|nr:MAG: hypothetical protein AUK31_06840 [Fibrobacteres bacterium CG2_30_45_31]